MYRVTAWTQFAAGLLLAVVVCERAAGGEVVLKNGMQFRGVRSDLMRIDLRSSTRPAGNVPVQPVLMVSTDLQRIFAPVANIARQDDGVTSLLEWERFKVPQSPTHGGRFVQGTAEIIKVGPWDKFGRRNVWVRVNSQQIAIIQGITEITPEAMRVTGINYAWSTAVAPSSVPMDQLMPLVLHAATRANGSAPPTTRQLLTAARFFIQAEMYTAAENILGMITDPTPDDADGLTILKTMLREAKARQLLDELQMRRRAGQHRLCMQVASQLAAMDASDAARRDANELIRFYQDADDSAVEIREQLSDLQARLPSDLASQVGPLRSQIVESLDYNNIGRLDAFKTLLADSKLTPENKLALALSGWILGSNNAVTDLNLAIRLWSVQSAVRKYLRTPNANERGALYDEMTKLEGMSAERVAQMLPLLPPLFDAREIEPGAVFPVTVEATPTMPAVRYHVVLPWEYHSDHQYPVIVALHSAGNTPEHEMSFWSGTPDAPSTQRSQRHGFIVIAPEYIDSNLRSYESNAVAHARVAEAIRDASHRFAVDPDRIFIAGHGMGGDAAIDIGISSPERFAGVISMGGAFSYASKMLVEANALSTAWYFLSGELNLPLLEANEPSMMRILERRGDIIYSEYRGVGTDSYYSEIRQLFTWMELHKRKESVSRFEFASLRPGDNRYGWLEVNGLATVDVSTPTRRTDAKAPAGQRRPSKIKGEITRTASGDANSIFVTTPTKTKPVLWLPHGPGMVDFDLRVQVSINGQQKWKDFVKPDAKAMLEDFRRRADRQRIAWAVLEF
jgi:predicted esterase